MIIFELILTTLKQASFFEADGAVVKIGSIIKISHTNQVWPSLTKFDQVWPSLTKFDQDKLVQILNTNCRHILNKEHFSTYTNVITYTIFFITKLQANSKSVID